jgi:hypothetical protein
MVSRQPYAYRVTPVYPRAIGDPPSMATSALMTCMATGVVLDTKGGGGEYLSPRFVEGLRKFATQPKPKFKEGDIVCKEGGDYTFEGTVVGVVTKLSDQIRFVVEDSRGLLFIFNSGQLKLVEGD